MKVTLNKQDLVNLVNGSDVPLRIETDSHVYSCVTWSERGFKWDKAQLNTLTENALYKLYNTLNK